MKVVLVVLVVLAVLVGRSNFLLKMILGFLYVLGGDSKTNYSVL